MSVEGLSKRFRLSKSSRIESFVHRTTLPLRALVQSCLPNGWKIGFTMVEGRIILNDC